MTFIERYYYDFSILLLHAIIKIREKNIVVNMKKISIQIGNKTILYNTLKHLVNFSH